MSERATESPLKPAVFHILLALSARDLHGLGIADAVEEATDGVVHLPPGTLYRALKEMAERDLVQEVDAPEADADPRRKYYRITEKGRAMVRAEAARFDRIVALARERNVLPEGA